jgi:DNA-binding CsgD family transcriptional regulator
VFDLFLESGSDKKVAALLHISAHTVRNHLGMIEQKMGMRWRCVLLLHWWKLRAGHCRVPPVPFEDVATRRNSSFTENEMVVLLLFLDLGSDQEVAARLRRSLSTVRTHLRSIQIKMDVDGREELLLYFWKLRAEPNRPVLLGGTKWYPRALEPPSPPGRGPG